MYLEDSLCPEDDSMCHHGNLITTHDQTLFKVFDIFLTDNKKKKGIHICKPAGGKLPQRDAVRLQYGELDTSGCHGDGGHLDAAAGNEKYLMDCPDYSAVCC